MEDELTKDDIKTFRKVVERINHLHELFRENACSDQEAGLLCQLSYVPDLDTFIRILQEANDPSWSM